MSLHKGQRIELGLAILGTKATPGVPVERKVLAAYAGCSPQAIGLIERRALEKCRKILEHRGAQLKFEQPTNRARL